VNDHLQEDAKHRHPAVGVDIVRPENRNARREFRRMKQGHENQDPDQQRHSYRELFRPQAIRGREGRHGFLGFSGHELS